MMVARCIIPSPVKHGLGFAQELQAFFDHGRPPAAWFRKRLGIPPESGATHEEGALWLLQCGEKLPTELILDLDDSVGFEIASNYQPNCSAKQDAMKATGAYPAFTLALTVKDANTLLAHGWPNAKKIGAIPEDMIPVSMISEERCVVVLMPREWRKS